MKIGFSSSVCLDWDLPQLAEQAQAMGYEALEITASRGRDGSADWSKLANSAEIKSALSSAGVELSCLATDFSFHSTNDRTIAEQRQALAKVVELAGKLGCPYVSLKTGSVPRFGRRDSVLLRIASALREAATHAAEHRVVLLVENAGNIASSRDLWLILDAANHPAAQCCWNPGNAAKVGDHSGAAVPRLGRRIMVTRVENDVLADGEQLGDHARLSDLSRFLVLMQGIGSDTRLIVHAAAPTSVQTAQEKLSKSLAWLKGQLDKIKQTPELTAYKGDKYAPRYAASSSRAPVHG